MQVAKTFLLTNNNATAGNILKFNFGLFFFTPPASALGFATGISRQIVSTGAELKYMPAP